MANRVHLWLRGQTWWIGYTLNDGTRIRRSLKTRSENKAERERARLEYLLRCDRLEETNGPERISMEVFLELYEGHLRSRKTKKSLQNDLSYLRGFLKSHGFRFLDEISTRHINAFLARRGNEDRVAPRTLNRTREVLHTMCAFALDQGYLETNPVTKIKRFREPEPEIVFLSSKEIVELLDVLSGDILQPLVATLIFAGLRRGEVCWLTWEDVELGRDPPMLHIRGKTMNGMFWQPKTKKSRRIPISSRLRPFLRNLHRNANGVPWVHPSPKGFRWDEDNLTERFRRTMKRHGLPWRIMDLRHTFASQLAANNVPFEKIALLMGNSPEIVRKHYARLIPEDLRKEVEF